MGQEERCLLNTVYAAPPLEFVGGVPCWTNQKVIAVEVMPASMLTYWASALIQTRKTVARISRKVMKKRRLPPRERSWESISFRGEDFG